MSSETISIIALIISGVGTIAVLIEKIFGGGNKLATQFHALDQKTTEDISKLRNEIMLRIDNHGDNSRVGFDSIQSNMHALKDAILELRVKMAEEYMRIPSFDKAIDELRRGNKEAIADVKKDMDDGFLRITHQLDAMSIAIEAGRKEAKKGM